MRLRSIIRPILSSVSILSLLLCLQGVAEAAIDCFSCHDRAAFQKRVKHSPAAEGECSTCHSPHVARYPGMLQEKVVDLCYSCHEESAREHNEGFLHEPVREGECLSCHDPHGSDFSGLLQARTTDTCFNCHGELSRKFKYTHVPYAQGRCDSCHRPHQSANPSLLVKDAESLCFGCHSRQTVQKKHPDFPAEVGNCGSCHSPHGSDRPAMIRNVLHEPFADNCRNCHAGKGKPVTVDTCLECHPEVSEQMASSHNHLVRFEENGCTACHSPHAGDSEKLLKGKERHVCGTCHDATFQRHDSAKAKHQFTDACSDCHAPHGSNHPAMFQAPINEVCSSCHGNHGVFTHPIGEQILDPRTGQMMTCASCHASKGTDYEFHTRFNSKRDLCVQCHRDY